MTQQSHYWHIPEKTPVLKDTGAPALTAALFTMARPRKQPGCPATDGWIRKLWQTYAMGYRSVTKRNESEPAAVRCMNLEPLIRVK